MSSGVLVLQALALSALPPTHIFGLLKQLCLAILQVACACAAEVRQVGAWVVGIAVSTTAVVQLNKFQRQPISNVETSFIYEFR